MTFISHADISSLWRRSLRNGTIGRLNPLQRGLLRAALAYSKMKGQIMNQRLVGMIRAVADRIFPGSGQRIFDRGMKRAMMMLENPRMKAFSAVEKWIRCDSFIFWLGTDRPRGEKAWILFGH